jgi:hypothetical protein
MHRFPDFDKDVRRPFAVAEDCYDCGEFYDGCNARPANPPTRCRDYLRLPDVMPGTYGQEFPPSRMGGRKEPRLLRGPISAETVAAKMRNRRNSSEADRPGEGKPAKPKKSDLPVLVDKSGKEHGPRTQHQIREVPEMRVTGTPTEDVGQAIEKVKAKATELGAQLDSIDIVDKKHILTWEDNQGDFVRAGITKEMYDDATSHGHEFTSNGIYVQVVRGEGQIGASITLFRGHNSGTLYHEFGHAADIQRRLSIPGYGSEEVARYVETLFIQGREGELTSANAAPKLSQRQKHLRTDVACKRTPSPAATPGPNGERLCGCGARLPKRKRCCDQCRQRRRQETLCRRRVRKPLPPASETASDMPVARPGRPAIEAVACAHNYSGPRYPLPISELPLCQ